MSKEKFEYYVNESNQAKEMTYFEALRLDENTFTEQDVKDSYRKLSLEFHPDKNDKNDKSVVLLAQISFQTISNAYECLLDPVKRAEYVESLKKDPKVLERRLDQLIARQVLEVGPNALVPMGYHDDLEKIIMQLTIIWQNNYFNLLFGTGVSEESLIDLFKKLIPHVKTPAECYAFHKLIKQADYDIRPTLKAQNIQKTTYLQKAAAQYHPLAMLDVIGKALSYNHFAAPRKKSIQWALKALRHLEARVIPVLTLANPDSPELKKIKDDMAVFRVLWSLPITIPSNQDAFDRLVEKLFKKQEDDLILYGLPEDHFIIDTDPEGYVCNPTGNVEALFLANLLQDFSDKIELLGHKNSKYLPIARKLHQDLVATATSYFKRKKEPLVDLERTKEDFVSAFASHINTAKPVLEKGFGLGEYLTNMLKALVNFIIKAVNKIGSLLGSETPFAFFQPKKPALYTETIAMEEKFNQNMAR